MQSLHQSSQSDARAGSKKYATFREFWPFYLGEHTHPTNRLLHVLGTAAAVGWIITAVLTHNAWYLLAAAVNGYACAWIGHLVFEKNRPATFKYPFKSFAADLLLFGAIITGNRKKVDPR